MNFTLVLPNTTALEDVLTNFSGTDANAGWVKPLQVFAQLGDAAWIIVAVFTIGIVYIRTNSVAAMSFVVLLFTTLFIAYVPSVVGKVLYAFVVFMFAAVLWIVFGKK